jgi:hypothetical protein
MIGPFYFAPLGLIPIHFIVTHGFTPWAAFFRRFAAGIS